MKCGPNLTKQRVLAQLNIILIVYLSLESVTKEFPRGEKKETVLERDHFLKKDIV